MKNPKPENLRQMAQNLSELKFFSVAEVALTLGVSTKSVRAWIEKGLLPAFRLGPHSKLIRVRHKDLEDFIETHTGTGQLHVPEEQ